MFSWIKRMSLLMLVNFLVMTTIYIVWSLLAPSLGLDQTYGGALIGWALMFGFGGAFASLFLSKMMAKMMFGLHMISADTRNSTEQSLLQMVHALAKRAGLTTMPEVAIYDSPEINAFATGPSRNSSLVAVSSGLLHRMNRDQVEGVLGHEVAHIANGDMVTMTLVQGVINTLVLLASRLIANVIASNVKENARFMVQFAVYMVLQIAFSILGQFVVSYFSRAREYRADLGGARYAGREKMLAALRALAGTENFVENEHQAFASLKISGKRASSLAMLLSTHPPLEDRIRRLEMAQL